MADINAQTEYLQVSAALEYNDLAPAPKVSEYNAANEYNPVVSKPADESSEAAARKTLSERLKETLKFAAMAGVGTAGLASLLNWV